MNGGLFIVTNHQFLSVMTKVNTHGLQGGGNGKYNESITDNNNKLERNVGVSHNNINRYSTMGTEDKKDVSNKNDDTFLEVDDLTLIDNNPSNVDAQKYRLFTRVTRDILHQFHTFSLPKGGKATMIIFHLVQVVTWVYNNEDYNTVIDALSNMGVDDITEHEYYNKHWWKKRTRRGTPSAAVHGDNIAKVRMSLEEDENFKDHMKEDVVLWFETFEKIHVQECTKYQMVFFTTYLLELTNMD